jgi:hypothetical protein
MSAEPDVPATSFPAFAAAQAHYTTVTVRAERNSAPRPRQGMAPSRALLDVLARHQEDWHAFRFGRSTLLRPLTLFPLCPIPSRESASDRGKHRVETFIIKDGVLWGCAVGSPKGTSATPSRRRSSLRTGPNMQQRRDFPGLESRVAGPRNEEKQGLTGLLLAACPRPVTPGCRDPWPPLLRAERGPV